MHFELSEALIKDLLFSMEDQMGDFLLDTQEGVIIGEEDDGFDQADEGGGRYISLPEWDSSDGFRLMEHFTAGLRNPAVRDELAGALNRGRGVFRAFKDIIARYPETEKLWFNYKERGMRREILRWYNALREEWGLERIGGEPEETEDLVLEDFRFRPAAPEDREAAAALHRFCLEEQRMYAAEHGLTAAWVPAFPSGESAVPPAAGDFPGDFGLTVETGAGEFAGYLAVSQEGGVLRIQALEVRSEYRGLGIGEDLLGRFIEEIRRRSALAAPPGAGDPFQILIDLPAGSEGFSQVLYRDSFKPYTVRYCLKVD
ncbi:MAG: GNAT family N-acetyltransferase [Treponema sp.]|jgi:ribosomal protein S18 acetylase RimI-like enzyme|nr:GNAT family N-acetyltransferase [Treponema sp.]